MAGKLFFISMILAIALIKPNAAFAKIEKGDQELAIDGSLTVLESYSNEGRYVGETTRFYLGASYGVSLTDEIQLGIAGRGSTQWDGDTGYDQFSFNGFLKYHFFTETDIVPYAGGQLGCTYTATYQPNLPDLESESFSYGGMLGIKWFIKENVSFYTEYNVNVAEDDWGSTLVTNQGLFGIALYF